jgi:hypothetical protein
MSELPDDAMDELLRRIGRRLLDDGAVSREEIDAIATEFIAEFEKTGTFDVPLADEPPPLWLQRLRARYACLMRIRREADARTVRRILKPLEGQECTCVCPRCGRTTWGDPLADEAPACCDSSMIAVPLFRPALGCEP